MAAAGRLPGLWALLAPLLGALARLGVGPAPAGALHNVTAELFGAEAWGAVAAFGDLNSDKQTDLFVLRERNDLIVFLADQSAPYFKPRVKVSLKNHSALITGVVPGDYDGDSQMDVLLTYLPKNHVDGGLSAVIFWGKNQTLDPNNMTMLNRTFQDEPLIMDFNGDLIPDVFGVTHEASQPQILLGGNLSWHPALTTKSKMRIPHSHAFIDLTEDFTADLFLTTLSATGTSQFEIWENVDGNFSSRTVLEKPQNMMVVGQSAFADFDGDGHMDHLLPGCEDRGCQRSAIYLARSGTEQWVPVLQDFSSKGTLWGFVPFVQEQHPMEIPIPITLRIGDYNMDGYPDALAILKNTSGSSQQAFLLENVPCTNASCEGAHRMFRVCWELTDLSHIREAQVATFFDIYEDGILDIVVLSRGHTRSDLAIHALKNNFEADAYFVKVIVLSGLCSNDCPRKITPFGVNQPGPYIMYTTVDANGYPKNGSAGQLSQSAHLALQLPYNVLGLGRSANFLDHLYVGIPRPSGEKAVRKQEWTAIIPNSQLIVIPYPHNVPRSWSAKLYLTPSNIVLLTAIALIGVCIFILAIIGVLHWQEKKADDREKRQEAHRFHFDAM
ncbi:T-cell immunomodulatory protein isoform X1 [Myotis myotis]|uniref:Integrin alpha FG-GAP repeat containing 1 n=3 Tax=Myotis myotis TaxID=51298 RepID=A0A7J7SCB4_MYOMY|nr:T-cell immunomodulatory protein isoform X1 [Myotis myotis]KAF6285787.1 integrin alpha FG-GAP repeat containing 1 [Myotis myotis]